MHRVLVIDDDIAFCILLNLFFKRLHYAVCFTMSGMEGIRLVDSFHPDLIILDVILKNESGIDICQAIRMISDVPILMISAIASGTTDMVEGLMRGADCYLTKPLDFSLLEAYVSVLLKRSTQQYACQSPHGYLDDYLTVNINTRQVRINNHHVCLSALDYELLQLLVCNPDQTVPSTEIVELLWPGQAGLDETTNLRTYVKRLREKIEPDPQNPRYILNEHGLGYRFVTQPLHKSSTDFL